MSLSRSLTPFSSLLVESCMTWLWMSLRVTRSFAHLTSIWYIRRSVAPTLCQNRKIWETANWGHLSNIHIAHGRNPPRQILLKRFKPMSVRPHIHCFSPFYFAWRPPAATTHLNFTDIANPNLVWIARMQIEDTSATSTQLMAGTLFAKASSRFGSTWTSCHVLNVFSQHKQASHRHFTSQLHLHR